jgi:RNA polymerase sigma-70 factor (ECF subfamily)
MIRSDRLADRLKLAHTTPANASSDDTLALARAAAAGDERAFEALYRATSGRVYAVCLRMAGDRERAAELTQDVFVRAWERMGAFRGDSAFESWLHRIAVNVVLESERSTRRRIARVEPTDDPAGVEGAQMLTRKEGHEGDRMDLEAAIAALPPATRRVFILHDIEGYRHEEISRMTGSAQGTLRAQLFRARRLLMEALTR